MRIARLLTIAALLFGAAAPGQAADLAVPRQQKATAAPRPAPAEAACLRWVEQTYSWYNYCDPVPYYGRQKGTWLGLF
jgi:hypothetical protein